jgi:hypothetical protein
VCGRLQFGRIERFGLIQQFEIEIEILFIAKILQEALNETGGVSMNTVVEWLHSAYSRCRTEIQ